MTQTQAYDCKDEAECGVQEGYPYYYDPSYKPDSFHTIVKATFFNAVLIPGMWYLRDKEAYKKYYGRERTDYLGFLTDSAYKSDWLKYYELIAFATFGLWGTSLFFDFLALFGLFGLGLFKGLASVYLEHIVSNFHLPLHATVMTFMVMGKFGWGNITLYFFYALANWALFRFFGMGMIKFLRPNYPYLNSNLKASVLYLFGIDKYQTTYPFMDVEWPTQESETSDLAEEVAIETGDAADAEVVTI